MTNKLVNRFFFCIFAPEIKINWMNRYISALSALLLLFVVSACDAEDPSLNYEKVNLTVGEVSLSSSLSEQQRQAVVSLLDNMVKVEPCQFYMGVQGRLTNRANYSSNFTTNYDSLKLTEHTNADGVKTLIKNSAFVDNVHLLDKRAYRHTLENGKVQIDTIYFTVVAKMPKATGSDNGNLWVGPVTQMCMPDDYYIGMYEVTQAQWMAVMGQWPTGRRSIDTNTRQDSAWYATTGVGDNYPAYNVWYGDAVAFCERLNQLCGMPNAQGMRFRLPTEAEWECAARGGRYTRGFRYPGSDDYSEVAWCSSNALYQEIGQKDYGMHPGGELLPNELGIYDMAGNVAEWVGNAYYRYSYRDSIANSAFNTKYLPKHAADGYVGDTLIVRGGSWHQSLASALDISSRQEYTHGAKDADRLQSMIMHCGFRIVLAK